MNSDFWNRRRVLITGHTGFKGSWLSLWLQSLGAYVTGIAKRPDGDRSLFEQGRVSAGMRSEFVDIDDFERVRAVMADARPEIIFHLAAQSLVRQSYRDPIETYRTNVLGTVHLLEAARPLPDVRAILAVTSDKCYENLEWDWGYREADRLGGFDPYSNSKACAELVVAAMRNSFFSEASGRSIGLATARAGNVIGGGDWSVDRLVPDLVRGFASGTPVAIRRPDALRPWQHVLDALSGYLSLAEMLVGQPKAFSEAWNFGPAEGDVRSVRWVADRAVEVWGGNASWRDDSNEPGPHEARLLKLDSSKARARLGWNPVWDLHRTIRETINWYSACAKGDDMHRRSLAQIEEYSRCK